MTFRSLALVALLAAACPAGVIVTSDGTRFEGDIKRAEGGWKITAANGKTNFVAASSVKSIELSGSGVGSSAAEGLQSLRRSVEASDDLPKIIERYKRFIDQQSTDPETAAEAKDDLATWQDRLERHLVKIGKQWVTPEQKKDLQAAASESADKARLLIKTGDIKEASQLLDEALQQDPTNISVLYLQGVLAESHGDVAGAQKDFSAVRQAAPDHPPTLMNLAVLAMRQKQWGAAATLMTVAMQAAPNTVPLVDAAAELLNAIPDDQRKSSAAIRLLKIFSDQDAALQKAMAAKKMYRWGATWVDQATMDKLAAADAAAKKKLADLQTDFDQTQARITSIDSQTADNNRAMREMDAHSWVVTADGTYVRAPLPTAYYELQKQNSKLRGERLEMAQRLDALRDAAKRAREDFPVPKFTGRVAIVGEDGMPVLTSAVPATNRAAPPASAPAPAPPIIKIGPAGEGD